MSNLKRPEVKACFEVNGQFFYTRASADAYAIKCSLQGRLAELLDCRSDMSPKVCQDAAYVVLTHWSEIVELVTRGDV